MTKGEQMLVDLGYEIVTDTPDYKFFRKNRRDDYLLNYDCFEIEITDGFVDKQIHDRQHCCHFAADLDFDEILACAEIVKELRENEKE